MKKSIKSCDIGGVAGGDKFIIHGILFKFAEDKYINDKWLYGIEYKCDYFAMKALNNEIKSLRVLIDLKFSSKLKNLNIPLMAMINYLGYSICAVSLLPIGKKTLVYGSNDAGKTVFINPEVEDIVVEIADNCNLLPHFVVDKKTEENKEIKLAIDVELHKVDNQFYILDFARLIPPNNPHFPFTHTFRYEYLKSLNTNKKISGDTFTGFGKIDNIEIDSISFQIIKKLKTFISTDFSKNILYHENPNQLQVKKYFS